MSDRALALAITAFIQLVLFMIAFLYHFEILPEKVFRQIEIMDFRSQINSKSQNDEMNPAKSYGKPTLNSFNQGSKNNPIPSKVELPKAMTQIDNPYETFDIPIEKQASLSPIKLSEEIGNTQEKAASTISQKSSGEGLPTIKDEPLVTSDDDLINSMYSSLNASGNLDSPYILEGDITQRNTVSKKIPEYPEGLQKNVTIKIEFSVLPNGSVGNVMVIQKADTVLENISINALKQWRFNPIPGDKIQTGTISFIFQLR
ncbi:MAG: energy transducer TonB [Candidatus Cloacimonetes bacterium]|nr:energy transducer TonB [Candidatus Cloacimonadota bacterium]